MIASRFLVSATLIGLAGAVAPAAEIIGGFVDMRLSGGITSGDYDVDVSAPNSASGFQGSSDGNFDENYRVTVNWVGSLGLRSYGGWIWGIGGTFNSHKAAEVLYVDNNDVLGVSDVDLIAWSADGFIGYALPIGEHLQLEVLPFIGIGRAYLDSPDVDGHLSRAADAYTEVGVDVNAVWTFRNGFQVGATGGMMYWESSIRNDQAAGTGAESENFKFAQWDPHFLLFLGVRL
jgi:hypothetical protein